MWNYLKQLLLLIGEIVIDIAGFLFFVTFLTSFATLLTGISPLIGSMTSVIAIAVFVVLAFLTKAWTNLIPIVIFFPLYILSLTAPSWAVYWGAVWVMLLIAAFLIPRTTRAYASAAFVLVGVIAIILAVNLEVGGNPFWVITALAIAGLSTFIFTQNCRPYEKRRAARNASQSLWRLALLIAIIGLGWNVGPQIWQIIAGRLGQAWQIIWQIIAG